MINNGTHKLSINGTLDNFFINMKTFILNVTDFQLIQDECDTFKLVFNTNINGVKMAIQDTKITSSTDTSTTSNTIKFTFYQNDVQLDEFTQNYTTSAVTQSAMTNRYINLLVHTTTNVKFFDFSSITNTFGYTLGELITSDIVTKSTKHRFFIKNVFYPFDNVGTKLYLLNQLNNLQCQSGIIKTNLLLSEITSPPYNIAEYCVDLFNCSTVTSRYRYTINGEMYLAVDKNIIVKS